MAERERPANWEDWKWLHRWPRLTFIEWALEWLVYWCRGLAIFEVLEFTGRASVLVAVIWWFWEAGDRTKQSHYRVWELIKFRPRIDWRWWSTRCSSRSERGLDKLIRCSARRCVFAW